MGQEPRISITEFVYSPITGVKIGATNSRSDSEAIATR